MIALDERGVLAATGPQRQKFLHGMLSNALVDLKPGTGCLASLMDVKGHLLALLRALVTENAVLLELRADRIAKLEATLLFYKVAAPVRFEKRDVAVTAVLGVTASVAIAKAGVEVAGLAAESHVAAEIAGVTVRVARASDLPAGGFVVHSLPEHAAAVREALHSAGAEPIGRATLDVLRIEDGRPWFGDDIGDENLLHETGLLKEYHSFSKGCYIGQEIVARLEGRGGNVNKMIRGLKLSQAAAAGATVTRQGKDVGRVTTAGVSQRLGPIALGFVHRGAFEPGTEVEVDGRPATVAALPFSLERPA